MPVRADVAASTLAGAAAASSGTIATTSERVGNALNRDKANSVPARSGPRQSKLAATTDDSEGSGDELEVAHRVALLAQLADRAVDPLAREVCYVEALGDLERAARYAHRKARDEPFVDPV